jgi:hypothetical protein
MRERNHEQSKDEQIQECPSIPSASTEGHVTERKEVMAKNGRKAAAKLAAQIERFEQMKKNQDSNKGLVHQLHRPGSLKRR